MANYSTSMSVDGSNSYNSTAGGYQIAGNDGTSAWAYCTLPDDYSTYDDCNITCSVYGATAPSTWGSWYCYVELYVNGSQHGSSKQIYGTSSYFNDGSGTTHSFSINLSSFCSCEYEAGDTIQLKFVGSDGGYINSSGNCAYLKSGTFTATGANIITLTFNANGGSGAPSSKTAEADESGIASFTIPSTIPTKENYKFLGWSTSKSATDASYEAGEDIELSENTILYAVWTQIIKYTLTYDANGGSGAPSSETNEVDEFGYASFKIPYTTPTREDYTFLGWDTSKSATWASYENGEIIEINTNTTLYAIWEKNPSYTLTFDANGGSGAPTKMSDVSDANGISSFKIPSTIPKRAGYIFDGWGESSDAIEPTYAINDTVTTTEDITLYAIWNLVVSIRVFKSGVLWTNCTRVLTLYSNNVLRYTLTSDGTGVYSAEYLEPDVYDLYVDGVDTGINVTLPHEDEVNPIKIQYHTVAYYASTADGGTVPKDTNIYLNGTSVSILDNVGGLVKDDCLFVGWNTTKDGTGTHYNAGDVIPITSSLKLYAIWIDDTINYVFDGAEYIPSDPIIHDEQGWKFAKMWVFTADGWES